MHVFIVIPVVRTFKSTTYGTCSNKSSNSSSDQINSYSSAIFKYKNVWFHFCISMEKCTTNFHVRLERIYMHYMYIIHTAWEHCSWKIDLCMDNGWFTNY